MNPRTALLALYLQYTVTPTMAWSHKGAFIGFSAYQGTAGSSEMDRMIDSCLEKQDSTKIAQGVKCAKHVITWLVAAAGSTVAGGTAVAVAQAGGVITPRGLKHDNSWDVAFLDRFNEDLSAIHEGHGLEGRAIVPSYLHPTNGFAVETNLHGNGTTLHVHTNGTHAMAVFDDDDNDDVFALGFKEDAIQKRSTDSHFYFDGIKGVKVEAYVVNQLSVALTAQDYVDVMSAFVSGPLGKSDKWIYRLCTKKGPATYSYGRITAERYPFGRSYEPIDNPPKCPW